MAVDLDQANDACPATVIPSLPYTDNGTTTGMANDYNPGTCVSSNAPDVIYEYTPTLTGVHTVSLCGTGWDTGLGIWTDGGCPGATNVGCSDGYCSTASQVSMILNVGVTYWFVVDGYSTYSGDYVINVTGPNATPNPGETCASALPLTVPGTFTGTTVGYANDYDAVCPYTGSTSPDVVYSYTPAADQQVTFDLCASSYDTKLYVIQDDCANTPIACNDDYCPGYQFLAGLCADCCRSHLLCDR